MKTMPGSILLGLEELLPPATRAGSAARLVRITAHIPTGVSLHPIFLSGFLL